MYLHFGLLVRQNKRIKVIVIIRQFSFNYFIIWITLLIKQISK